MPCWEELTPTQRRRKVQEMIAEIEEEAAAKRQENGKSVMGMARVQRTSPLKRPENFKKSKRPASIWFLAKFLGSEMVTADRKFYDALAGGPSSRYLRWVEDLPESPVH